MAKLFPVMNPNDIENPGERRVAKALVDQLPNRVEVFHSFNWLRRNGRGTLLEGECDFVLLDPNRGVLFVEVKGGSLIFDGREWIREVGRDRRSLNKDPFSQASKSMHTIVDLIKKSYPNRNGKLPFTYGFAVAFPDCQISGPLPPSIQPDLILDADRIKDLENSIVRVLKAFDRGDSRKLSVKEIESIRESLYPKYELLPVLWRKIEDQEDRLQRMTNEQMMILDILANHRKALIRGVAGSGKTILALAKAQSLARSGMRTLLLCYNRPLKDWLSQAVSESFRDNLVIDNYHSLAIRMCNSARVPLEKNKVIKTVKISPTSNLSFQHTEHYWYTTIPDGLMEACERLGQEHKFDAIIVDEGQDFHTLMWVSLDSLFKDPNNKVSYYVFYDPKQNLFVENPPLPDELGQPYDLVENCRNTKSIAEHCASLAGYESHSREGAPNGDIPENISVRTLDDAFKETAKRVRLMCMPNQGGLKMSQIAVLAPGFTKKEWPERFESIPLTTDFNKWRSNENVLMASWDRFKGLEADAIVIIEPPMKEDPRSAVNRYVARSRAKHLLTIIEVEK